MVIRNQSQQGQFGAQRGAAGETRMSGPRLQFSNLYQMNRDQSASQKAYEGFQKQANEANKNMASAVNQAQGLQQAAGLANKTEGWSVGGEAMKKGLSGTQAAITDLYSGGRSNPYTSKIRDFGNIYANAKANFPKTQEIPGQAVAKPPGPEKKGPTTIMTQAEADAINKQKANDGHETRVLGTLDWALKTGRITAEEYYAAQGGPGTEGFEAIKEKLV